MKTKFQLWLEGWSGCLGWIFKSIWDNCLVDLHFKTIPWAPEDFIAFAERWNGRFAMLGVLIILQIELAYHMSIWQFLGFV